MDEYKVAMIRRIAIAFGVGVVAMISLALSGAMAPLVLTLWLVIVGVYGLTRVVPKGWQRAKTWWTDRSDFPASDKGLIGQAKRQHPSSGRGGLRVVWPPDRPLTHAERTAFGAIVQANRPWTDSQPESDAA